MTDVPAELSVVEASDGFTFTVKQRPEDLPPRLNGVADFLVRYTILAVAATWAAVGGDIGVPYFAALGISIVGYLWASMSRGQAPRPSVTVTKTADAVEIDGDSIPLSAAIVRRDGQTLSVSAGPLSHIIHPDASDEALDWVVRNLR